MTRDTSIILFSRKQVRFHERAAVFHAEVEIDEENLHRRSTGCRSTDETRAMPAKVTIPGLPARIKEQGQLSRERIQTGDVRALERIAVITTQGEIP